MQYALCIFEETRPNISLDESGGKAGEAFLFSGRGFEQAILHPLPGCGGLLTHHLWCELMTLLHILAHKGLVVEELPCIYFKQG